MGSATASEPPPERVAERYTLQRQLGAGGMGKVFEAIDETDGRRLALKLLHARIVREREDLVSLFKKEYYTLKQLSHPLFVEVYDYGVDACGPFFTMELLPESDLSKAARMPWRQACGVLRDIASALAMLHSRGVLYRDLSAANVKLRDDGQAKLFDFGALASRDVAQSRIVGTPPYIAPEAVHVQPLDARTDLFALGALGYFLLSGRHAYPASKLSQLRDLWRTAPRPPSAHGVECPPTLDELVMSLLSLDPRARPPHAAEVIDRLAAIAELEPQPALHTASAYLNRPTLVEREREILVVRKQLIRMLRGRGGALRIESAPGMGRTRMLEESILEAKLIGATVLHVPVRAGSEAYEVVRQLVAQALRLLPEVVLEAAAACAGDLGLMIPELAARLPQDAAPTGAPTAAEEMHARFQDALSAWFAALCRQRRIVIAIDDLQHCDHASLAAIASLSLLADEQPLVVVATLPSDHANDGVAAATFRHHARQLELPPLSREGTMQLYRHVFGDVAHLPELASWAEGVAKGCVQHYMTLARDLCERGAIRYADGIWALPRDLQTQALPQSLADAFAQRIDALGPAAVAVAEMLCVLGAPASPADCIAFCSQLDEAGVFTGCDELLAAGFLLSDGRIYAFRQRAIEEAFDQRIADQERRAHHRRIGLALNKRQAPSALQRLQTAFHLLHGGEDAPAVDLIVAAVPELEELGYELDRRAIDAIELGLAACEGLGRPPSQSIPIRLALLTCAFLFDQRLLELGLPAVDRLELDSGMSLLDELDPKLSLLERAMLALGRAGERFATLPESERVFDPVKSAGELGKALLTTQAIYGTRYDVPRARECCRRFEPLAALNPIAQLGHDAMLAAVDALVGRLDAATQMQQSVAERALALLEQGAEEPGAVRLKALVATMAYLVGFRRAFTDPKECMRLADLIDRVGAGRAKPGASQLRMLASHLAGDAAAAQRFGAQLDARLVRHRVHASSGIDLPHRIRACVLGDDLLGLKAAVDELEGLAVKRPGYRPMLHIARAQALVLRAEHERALAEYHEALRFAAAGTHSAWATAISGLFATLVELGRLDEARACVEQARRDNAANDLDGTLEELMLPALAQLEALEGQPELATRRLEGALDAAIEAALPCLVVGHLLQQLLRVALIARDEAMFRRHAKRLLDLYSGTDNRALHSAYRQLMQRARTEGVIAVEDSNLALVEAERSKVDVAFATCTNAQARAQCALTLLVDDLRAPSGYLFALRGGELHLSAAPAQQPQPPPSMLGSLREYLAAELEEDEAATATSFDETEQITRSQAFEDGRNYRPVVLRTRGSGESLVAGIAALEVRPGDQDRLPNWALIEALGQHLIRAGDVEPERSAY